MAGIIFFDISSGVTTRDFSLKYYFCYINAGYAATCDERYQPMTECDEGVVLYVDELPESEILNFSNLKEDIAQWKNVAWKLIYWRIDMVVKD